MAELDRSIAHWLAPIVQQLELEGESVVTVDDIQQGRPDLPRAMIYQAIEALVHRGWLSPTGVRGVYEFVPGAAAGPYPSNDPWIPLRAALRRERNEAVHLGPPSAAWVRGYAQRSPEPHFLVAPIPRLMPRYVTERYHVLGSRSNPPLQEVNGLPVPSPAGIFAETAQLAPRLPLDSASGWVRRLLEDVPPDEAADALRAAGAATRARAGYMAEAVGAQAHADAIEQLGPLGAGPYYTGRQKSIGPYSARWRVYDSGRFAPQ
jgi:AbiEi antitoxin C-terminal domain